MTTSNDLHVPNNPYEERAAYYSTLFNQTSVNLLNLKPSQIKDQDILDLEALLSDAYFHAYQEGWSADIQDAILDGLAHASELSAAIQYKPNQPLTRDFYRNLKKFVGFFQIIAVFLADEKNMQLQPEPDF